MRFKLLNSWNTLIAIPCVTCWSSMRPWPWMRSGCWWSQLCHKVLSARCGEGDNHFTGFTKLLSLKMPEILIQGYPRYLNHLSVNWKPVTRTCGKTMWGNSEKQDEGTQDCYTLRLFLDFSLGLRIECRCESQVSFSNSKIIQPKADFGSLASLGSVSMWGDAFRYLHL